MIMMMVVTMMTVGGGDVSAAVATGQRRGCCASRRPASGNAPGVAGMVASVQAGGWDAVRRRCQCPVEGGVHAGAHDPGAHRVGDVVLDAHGQATGLGPGAATLRQ